MTCWYISPDQPLKLWRCDPGLMVYHCASGDTHYIQAPGSDILQQINTAACSEQELLASQQGLSLEDLQQVLEQLQTLNLVQAQDV